eukprot:jgi/Chrzof1/4683/Cz14g22200.t1
MSHPEAVQVGRLGRRRQSPRRTSESEQAKRAAAGARPAADHNSADSLAAPIQRGLFFCAECGEVLTSRDEFKTHQATAHGASNFCDSDSDDDYEEEQEEEVTQPGGSAASPSHHAPAAASRGAASPQALTRAVNGTPVKLGQGPKRRRFRRRHNGVLPTDALPVYRPVTAVPPAQQPTQTPHDRAGHLATAATACTIRPQSPLSPAAASAVKAAVTELWVPKRRIMPGANGARVVLLQRPHKSEDPASATASDSNMPSQQSNKPRIPTLATASAAPSTRERHTGMAATANTPGAGSFLDGDQGGPRRKRGARGGRRRNRTPGGTLTDVADHLQQPQGSRPAQAAPLGVAGNPSNPPAVPAMPIKPMLTTLNPASMHKAPAAAAASAHPSHSCRRYGILGAVVGSDDHPASTTTTSTALAVTAAPAADRCPASIQADMLKLSLNAAGQQHSSVRHQPAQSGQPSAVGLNHDSSSSSSAGAGRGHGRGGRGVVQVQWVPRAAAKQLSAAPPHVGVPVTNLHPGSNGTEVGMARNAAPAVTGNSTQSRTSDIDATASNQRGVQVGGGRHADASNGLRMQKTWRPRKGPRGAGQGNISNGNFGPPLQQGSRVQLVAQDAIAAAGGGGNGNTSAAVDGSAGVGMLHGRPAGRGGSVQARGRGGGRGRNGMPSTTGPGRGMPERGLAAEGIV